MTLLSLVSKHKLHEIKMQAFGLQIAAGYILNTKLMFCSIRVLKILGCVQEGQ